jgi:hypothetical protein
MEKRTLYDEVAEMKAMSKLLVPFTFPVVDFKVEQDILLFKQRSMTVDGFELLVCYSKADYDDHFLESVQIQSSFAPFVPFSIVCKVGRAFLGQHNLSYIEFFRNNKKVYCWTLKSRDERPLPPDKKTKPGSYEGFDYSILQPGSVDLF